MLPEVHSIATTTHGRVLARPAIVQPPRGTLTGFHGYMENAAIQLARLEGIPGADAWTLVSVQALHRFYRGRTQEIAASWMTKEDRELAIADNLEYVTAALRVALPQAPSRVVHVGFSQGVAMAFRAAVRAQPPAAGVIAVGGDVPPELLADPTLGFPPVFLARGVTDDWYTAQQHDVDVSALRSRGAAVHAHVYEAGHEWTHAVAAAAAGWLDAL